MLQLRYNGVMLKSGDVAQVTYKVSIRPNNGMYDNTARARHRWFHFLNVISKGIFFNTDAGRLFRGVCSVR